jgi:hypothetical protein
MSVDPTIHRATMSAPWRVVVAVALLVVGAAQAQAQTETQTPSASTDTPVALRERHAALQDALRNNSFGRALHLHSVQTSGDLRGDIHAVLDHPFETVSARLSQPGVWCEVMILHQNVKHCRLDGAAAKPQLTLHIGRKYDQPLEEAYQLDFTFRQPVLGADYLNVGLRSETGPLGTRDYRITVSAVPLPGGQTFLHLSYAYGYGMAARMAMQAYLATVGSAKIGFTVTERRPDGTPVYIGGVRGVVERNTMRYYLAIDAYLGALGLPVPQQQERRLRNWHAATERYAPQLHEVNEADYLAMKRKEIAR